MPGSLLQLKDLQPVRQTDDAQMTAMTGIQRGLEECIFYALSKLISYYAEIPAPDPQWVIASRTRFSVGR